MRTSVFKPWLLVIFAWLTGGCTDTTFLSLDGDAPILFEEPDPLDFDPNFLPLEPEAPAEPAAPDPAESPALAPCPEGWVEEMDGAVATCAPWDASVDPTSCPDDSVLWPGTSSCTLVGSPCPTGSDLFLPGLPDMGVIYVQAGAAAGGDGSRLTPYNTLAEGLASAASGDIVALSVGDYDETAHVPSGVTVLGACVAGTRIAPSAPEGGALSVEGTGVVARNLTLSGNGLGLWADGDVEITLEDVVIADAKISGIGVIRGATLHGERVAVRRTRPGDAGFWGRGMTAEFGGQVVLDRVLIEDNYEWGVVAVQANTSVDLTHAVVRGTNPRVATGAEGVGLQTDTGGTLTLRESVVERNSKIAIVAAGSDTTLSIADTVIRETRTRSPQTGGNGGRGITTADGASTTLERVLLEDNKEVALITPHGGNLQATDVVIRGVDSNSLEATQAPGEGGRGISVQSASSATLSRVWIEETHEFGLFVSNDSTIVATDLTIVQTFGRALDGRFGHAFQIHTASQGVASRVRIEGAREAAMAILNGSDMEIHDLSVRPLDVPDEFASGIHVQGGAQARIERARIEDFGMDGFHVVGEGSRLTATDLRVAKGIGRASDGLRRGGEVSDGASLLLVRSSFERTGSLGLIVADPGTTATVEDVTMLTFQGSENTGELGAGLHVLDQAELDVTRAHFEGMRDSSILIDGEATAHITDLSVMKTESDFMGTHGRALSVQGGAEASVTRFHAIRNREIAIAADGEGTRLTLENLLVEETNESACAADACSGFTSGAALGSSSGAHVGIRDFRISDSSGVGLMLVGGLIEAQRGVVRDNPIGANIQTAGVSVSAITNEVVYFNNIRNLDATDLPLPPTSTAGEPLSVRLELGAEE